MTELREITPHQAITDEKNRRDSRVTQRLRSFLPELLQLERVLAEAPATVSTEVIERVGVRNLSLPIYRVDIGCPDPDAPVILMVGGVHGLERIGCQVVIAWMRSLISRMAWDSQLQALLGRVHITLLPMLNPGGMYLNQRANPKGVDLMRNAPITAQGRSTFLLGGQRLSKRLPWFTGTPEEGLEAESQALANVVQDLLPGRPFSIALDCHSGFGWKDQLWFPYAYRRRPMRRVESVFALKLLWERSYPNHDYEFEPQSEHYLTHGDLWDYFYKLVNRESEGMFIPLTLEMGSWRWIRKRPRQLLRLQGLFNPMVPHRLQRVLRRHLLLMDFLMQAAADHARWLPKDGEAERLREAAILHWYKEL